MSRSFWLKIRKEISIWPGVTLPGIVIIGLVILFRLTGALQLLEWLTIDTFLRLRPSEPMDQRVVIIGINEEDIGEVGSYPIPDEEIASLLEKLQTYKPRVIGLDLIRDLPVNPGHQELVAIFQEWPNIIGIEKVLPHQIAPPPELPSAQVGFADTLIDKDGNVRRSLLGTPVDQGYQFSLSLRLAETYLQGEGITLENGIKDLQAMRFGTTELPRFLPNSGGYVRTDAGGVQVLLNYRSGQEPFLTLSLNDIKTGNFNPNLIRDRIIIIGMTAPSVKDFVHTSAIANLQPVGQIYGVEFHAHATSQILSAVLEQRVLLRTWSDPWEYLWIVAWGMLAISFARNNQSPWNNLLIVGVVSLGLVIVTYILIVRGWWIPVAPVLLVLTLNGIGLAAFSQYDRGLKSQIEVRQRTIEQAFNLIHNGPMQTLAYIRMHTQNQDLSQDELLSKLEEMRDETWEVAEYLKQDALTQEETIRLGNNQKLELQLPINKLFSEVCRETLERNFPYFDTLKVKAIKFEPIPERYLTIEHKRELCQFLEESLCNIGKHAQGVTRLSAIGSYKGSWYTLSIKDNGSGISSSRENRGTRQARSLEKQLGGKFKRERLSPRGTLCELTWPLVDKYWGLGRIRHSLKSLFRIAKGRRQRAEGRREVRRL
ncbi:MAG: CHASE2 domain-containing protein [Symploca sp. SIO1C2]|nr:CHASE2 domain-containing protein [Symploca sp. SIO1C2]